MLHVYRRHKEGDVWLYTVGYYWPRHYQAEVITEWEWVPLEDTSREDEARALVNYLNGGEGRVFRYPLT